MAKSSYVFNVPSRSSILTFSASIRRLAETYDPATLRQFAQWQRCPRGFVKSSLSLMVTVMEPHKQEPERDSENSEVSCEFGSPVGWLGMTVEVQCCRGRSEISWWLWRRRATKSKVYEACYQFISQRAYTSLHPLLRINHPVRFRSILSQSGLRQSCRRRTRDLLYQRPSVLEQGAYSGFQTRCHTCALPCERT